MEFLYIVLGIAAVAATLVILISYICFYMAFYAPDSKKVRPEFELPPGKEYEPYHEQMLGWMRERNLMPYTDMQVTSFDGLMLKGKYYELTPGAPIELMFHGYRGSAERDLCGGIQRCFKLGRNVLIVDQRAHGLSDGNVISFGAKEKYDVLSWINLINEKFGNDTKIILCGISMGAATVMMATGENLPENVVGVLADCGYTSARNIICKVIDGMKLPSRLLYPFVRLGAKIFGGFDPNDADAVSALKNCKIPIMFIHGEDDDFVPCEMSHHCFNAVSAPKGILTVKGAGHGAAYLADPEKYLLTVAKFYSDNGIYTEANI